MLWRLVDSLQGHEVTALAGSSNTLLAVTEQGQVFSWGTPQAAEVDLPFARARRAAPLPALAAKGVTAVAAGEETLLALAGGLSPQGAITGDVWEWAGDEAAPRLLSGALPAGLRVGAIACGAQHALACAHGGAAFSWGANDEGQLGQGDCDDRAEPAAVPLPAGFEAVDVACGDEFTLLVGDGSW